MQHKAGCPAPGLEAQGIVLEEGEACECDECDSCAGRLSAETEVVECKNDSQMADDDFTPSETDPSICENDGWLKIEHELNRPYLVHGSCFLDHDDILART